MKVFYRVSVGIRLVLASAKWTTLLSVSFKTVQSEFPLDKCSLFLTVQSVLQMQEVTLDVNLEVKTGRVAVSYRPVLLSLVWSATIYKNYGIFHH